jgi:hypothetical protein
VQQARERISVGAWFLVPVFPARFAENFLSMVCMKFFNQGLM